MPGARPWDGPRLELMSVSPLSRLSNKRCIDSRHPCGGCVRESVVCIQIWRRCRNASTVCRNEDRSRTSDISWRHRFPLPAPLRIVRSARSHEKQSSGWRAARRSLVSRVLLNDPMKLAHASHCGHCRDSHAADTSDLTLKLSRLKIVSLRRTSHKRLRSVVLSKSVLD